MNKYPALSMIASLLKTVSILLILFGIGISLWFVLQADSEGLSLIIGIGGIVASIVAGLILYAMSDFFRCVMDIEANTRLKEEVLVSATTSRGKNKAGVRRRMADFFRLWGGKVQQRWKTVFTRS
jgi:hypothetical protein